MPVKEKSKRPKQMRIPAVEDARLEDLHSAAEEYVELRDERMDVLKREIESGEQVKSLMKKHKKNRYVCDGVTITIESEEKIKVKIKKGQEEE